MAANFFTFFIVGIFLVVIGFKFPPSNTASEIIRWVFVVAGAVIAIIGIIFGDFDIDFIYELSDIL